MNGRKLAQLRGAAGLTQLELAIRAGITPNTLASLETGARTNPRLATLEALAKALGVSVAELLTEPAAAATRRKPA